jgi:ABC-2 type transport system permease protein
VSAYFAFTMARLFYASILFYGQAVRRGVVEEKRSRVAEVVLASVSPGSATPLLLFLLLGYTVYAALFGAAGATVSHEQDGQQAQAPVTLLLVYGTRAGVRELVRWVRRSA